MLSIRGRHFPKAVILMAVRWYVAYALSYRDIEELMHERGAKVDHAAGQRWVTEYSPEQMEQARKVIQSSADSWRMDKAYIKIKGEWVYLYRAVDRFGNAMYFMLSRKRDKPVATRFFAQAIGHAGIPRKVAIDKSGAGKAGINAINVQLATLGFFARTITVFLSKYLNNIVEQDHCFIKKITRPMLGFKRFFSAEATLAGIELHHIIRKGQLDLEEATCPYQKLHPWLASPFISPTDSSRQAPDSFIDVSISLSAACARSCNNYRRTRAEHRIRR